MDVTANGKVVLLVEDNETYRTAVRFALEASGLTVIEAANGKIGLELLSQNKPAMVVSDVMMPEMDGNTMLTTIKSNPETKTLPVVMLTNMQEELDKAVKSGAEEAVFKATVTPKQIAEMCLRHLNGEVNSQQ